MITGAKYGISIKTGMLMIVSAGVCLQMCSTNTFWGWHVNKS